MKAPGPHPAGSPYPKGLAGSPLTPMAGSPFDRATI